MSLLSFGPKRGMRDFGPKASLFHRKIIERIENIALLYNVSSVSTPLIESIDLFKRTLGNESDVVGKEMYQFCDRSGEEVCLRPEGTAGVMRFFLNEFGKNAGGLKRFYSVGPMFRYERPQKGRYRQFDQFSVEFIGSDDPFSDAELIAMGRDILRAFGLSFTLEINTIGTLDERISFKKDLVSYLKSFEDALSDDSKRRLYTNPLRILDSKEECDRRILENAPVLREHLKAQSINFYTGVLDHLKNLEVPFVENHQLVRGLDYYNATTFEFKISNLGAQSTVIAGGRYDGLSEQLSGTSIPSVGFAVGIDRIALVIDEEIFPKSKGVGVISIGQDMNQNKDSYTLCERLREKGIRSSLFTSNSFGKGIKACSKEFSFGLIIGEDEVRNHNVILKNFITGEQVVLSWDLKDIDSYL